MADAARRSRSTVPVTADSSDADLDRAIAVVDALLDRDALDAGGHATIVALQLNRPARIAARRRWASVGWHPPKD